MILTTPVAFLIFNRPDLTEIIFEAIRQAKPKKLLVVADGPRFPEEIEKCEQTRAIIKRVDWDCEVLTNFSEKNLGCGRRISTGISWVFSQVEEAIFLEDDTLPTPSFFLFCQTLLERYRDDERVMHITGDNSLGQIANIKYKDNIYSYYFSKYAYIWGWASWRRAWQYYDYNINTWNEFKKTGLLELVFDDKYEQKYWLNIFDQMSTEPPSIDTWDYQWLYACWFQSGLTIAPNKNLISNLGFNRVDAAHTKGDSLRANLQTTDIWEIKHPPFVARNREIDNYAFDYIFYGKQMKEDAKLNRKICQKVSLAKSKFASFLKNDLSAQT